jgi:hypothetical protein
MENTDNINYGKEAFTDQDTLISKSVELATINNKISELEKKLDDKRIRLNVFQKMPLGMGQQQVNVIRATMLTDKLMLNTLKPQQAILSARVESLKKIIAASPPPGPSSQPGQHSPPGLPPGQPGPLSTGGKIPAEPTNPAVMYGLAALGVYFAYTIMKPAPRYRY